VEEIVLKYVSQGITKGELTQLGNNGVETLKKVKTEQGKM
jgi:hypothetical protein